MPAIPTRKYLRFSDLRVTKKQILHLASLEARRGQIMRHDVSSPLVGMRLMLDIASFHLKKLERAIQNGNRTEIKIRLQQLSEEISNADRMPLTALRLIRLLFPYDPKGDRQSLITKPMRIMTIVRDIFPSLNLSINAKSWRSLEFLYSESILSAVIFELISNAAKHVGEDCNVITTWRIVRNKFEFEVHDDGKGIIRDLSTSFIPMSDITAFFKETRKGKSGRYGLSIVNELVFTSGGKMLVSRSPLLGGTMVWLDIPITIYYKKGEIHDLGRRATN